MKVLGRAAAEARGGLTDGSTSAAWRRAGLFAIFALAIVLIAGPARSGAGVGFSPTVTFQTSTTQSAAHPDLRVTVDNSASGEDLKSLDISLPEGMWGSLDAAVPCKWDTTANNAVDGTCLSTAKIGSVTAEATTKATPTDPDSDMKLSGDVFLTDAATANASTDPAGITAVVQAKVGGVDLGKVVVHGRAIPVYKTLSGSTYANLPSGTLGPAVGLRTIVDDIPNEITDTHNRTVTFHTTKMTIDLKSDQSPPRQPLLTNQSRCNAAPVPRFSWSAGSHEGGSPVTGTQNYAVTNCSAVARGTTNFDVTLSNPTVGQNTSIVADLTMKQDASTIRKATMSFPSMMQFNANSLGSNAGPGPAQQCPDTAAAGVGGQNPVQVFNPANCPDSARFGSVKIWTPLLPNPLVGYSYFVQASPIPNIGVWISPTTDAGAAVPNPEGITLSLFGATSTLQIPQDTGCSDPYAAACALALTVTFDGLPSAPVSRIQFDSYRDDRPTLEKSIFTVASASNDRCQRTADVSGRFYYYSSGTVLAENFGEISDPLSFPGCNQPDPAYVSSSTSPIGTRTTDTSPIFDLGVGATGHCSVDFVNTDPGDPENEIPPGIENYLPCGPTFEPNGSTAQAKNPLSVGLHHLFFAPDGGNERVRSFVIDPPSHETTAPTVTFDSGPSGDTADSTPSFAFHADESSLFQCSVDSGAFLPCTNTTTLATSSTFDIATPFLASDDDHTVSVRAADQYGNTGAAVTRTFQIVIPFDPTFSVDNITTYEARKHPEMDVTITSLSHEDVDKLTLSLPDGFLGSLRGAAQCDKNVANAGNCTAASQVGTVETEAAIDESIVRVNGFVYMTTPWVDSDPAGLVVKVPAKIQDVDLGFINVPIRLTVRGQVKGIDSVAVDVPNSIDPADHGNTFDQETFFDMRSIKLKLRNNNTASQPLLTNPSSCAATEFKSVFTGKDDTSATKTQAFAATNCGALGLAPQMSLSLIDTRTGKVPAESSPVNVVSANLTADITADPNGSGMSSASMLLPKPVTVNVPNLPPVCQVETYTTGGAEACPATSIVGSAKADSPLLLTPLEGKVYLVKSNVPGITLPRVLIALRGAIDTDIFGNMRFENVSQIRTTFPELPDAPISSFHIAVDKVISTRDEACQYGPAERNAVTSFNGYSGANATAVNGLDFSCNGSGSVAFKNKGKKSTMTMSLRAPDGVKFRSFSVKVPKGIKLVKKGMKKGLTFKAGTKKQKYTCVKTTSNKFSSTLCKKYNQRASLSFKAGTLTATKKVKKPKFQVTAKDSLGRTYSFTLQSKK